MDMSNPGALGENDINSIGSGYAPLSARLVEQEINELPGGTIIDYRQKSDTKGGGLSKASISGKTQCTLVFFIGGVTYGEISALRMLDGRDPSRKFICAATNIIHRGFWEEEAKT